MDQIDGFLLTRHWQDRPDGLELRFWACTGEGPLELLFPAQEAVCFIERERSLPAGLATDLRPRRRPLELETLAGTPVDGLYFRRMEGLQQLRELATRHGLRLCESDVKPADRFLMERFVTAPFRAEGRLERAPAGHLRMHAPRLRPGDWRPAPRWLSLDIETDGGRGQILSIAWTTPDRELVLIQGDAADWPRGQELPLHWFPDEHALLKGFLERFSEQDPDLILGWNLINFDLDYLERRCRRHGLPFAIGRGGESARVLAPRQGGQARIAMIPGRVALDGIEQLRAAFWSFDSYALDRVARALLGRGKLIDEESDRIGEIRRLFRDDRPALAAYNLEDCRLVAEIFAHTRLIDFTLERARLTGLTLGRQGGSVAAFDNLYLPRLHRSGAVAWDIGAFDYDATSPGGYVMDSRPGLYDNVLVLDFKSLYPSIIRTFLIDPLGMARPGDDAVPGFLGARFARQGHILPGIIEALWRERDSARRHGDAPLSQAVKILMNSFYGVLGASGCRFRNPALTSSITRRGHQIITRSRDWIERQGVQVIYGDTDSLFVLLGPGVEEADARRRGAELADGLNRWWRQRIAAEFDLESRLEIEFETHYLRFLMPTIRGAETGSKKRYAGVVRDADGELRVRFKGLESVRSDWTPLARRFQQELYRRIFFDEPYDDFVRETVRRLRAGKLDPELVYRKRLRRPLDSYRKNLPPHVQAARKLSRPGRVIDYLITVNGPEPARARTSPIDYDHYIERQLAPAADGILHFEGRDLGSIVGDQMALF